MEVSILVSGKFEKTRRVVLCVSGNGSLIGRGAAGLSLVDQECSRTHLSLSQKNGKLFVTDLGSRNGTFVNARLVTTKELVPGDVITIGRTRLKIFSVEGRSQNSFRHPSPRESFVL